MSDYDYWQASPLKNGTDILQVKTKQQIDVYRCGQTVGIVFATKTGLLFSKSLCCPMLFLCAFCNLMLL